MPYGIRNVVQYITWTLALHHHSFDSNSSLMVKYCRMSVWTPLMFSGHPLLICCTSFCSVASLELTSCSFSVSPLVKGYTVITSKSSSSSVDWDWSFEYARDNVSARYNSIPSYLFFFFISLFILDRHPQVGFFLPSSCDIHTMRCDIHIRSSAHVTFNDNIAEIFHTLWSASNQWPTSKPYMMAGSIHTRIHLSFSWPV